MPGQRRTAWGEFAELLAVRVGEASCPGPAAAAGQRTLCLAPGGLGLAGGLAAAPGPPCRHADDPRAGRSPCTPARPDGQRTLDFGSASSVPVPRAGSPHGGDEEETSGEVRSFLAAFGRPDVDSPLPPAPTGARLHKRIRAVGGQACLRRMRSAHCARPLGVRLLRVRGRLLQRCVPGPRL